MSTQDKKAAGKTSSTRDVTSSSSWTTHSAHAISFLARFSAPTAWEIRTFLTRNSWHCLRNIMPNVISPHATNMTSTGIPRFLRQSPYWIHQLNFLIKSWKHKISTYSKSIFTAVLIPNVVKMLFHFTFYYFSKIVPLQNDFEDGIAFINK